MLKFACAGIAALSLLGVSQMASGQTPPNAPAPASPAPRIALTFDDMPAHGPLPPGVTRLDVVHEIIAALKKYHAPAFGFMNGGFGADNPQSPRVLAAWRAAGHPIGNHTYNHLNLNEKGVAAFEAQMEKNVPILKKLMKGHDWRWLRFPYLAEGKTPQQRDSLRHYLGQHGYRIAAVTMSFGDYGWNVPYARCMEKGNHQAVGQLEASYLGAAREQALKERKLSHELYGRDIPYVLLMHLGAFDAHMLPRLLKLYHSMGFTFISLPKAESDPFYKTATDMSLPGPSPSLEAAARARNIAVPPTKIGLPDANMCG
ncbi:polysaccharide deacetylase family protein [Stakelama sediminis]|uniref:Chitooligosaccharide deacetylase n=1 Tax=Stakelama sediminis TaxID=463200 RepID=A0A840Z1Q3_9SPHN|nr:polysaccharide deacetylase family protein [Stakelama sediminis]MBB5719707.1 peptidoglycan/xylan/chitin deacetylase (PgdA/CDA1 family) [Stakelama sediminis]